VNPIVNILTLLSQLIKSPVGQGLLTYFGSQEQQSAVDEANQATQERFNEARGIIDQNRQNVPLQLQQAYDQEAAWQSGIANRQQAELRNLATRLMGRGNNIRSDIVGQLANRENDLVSQLQGLGTQARQDLNANFDIAGSNAVNDLRSRGLGSSSLVAGALGGNERERSNALGRLEEQLRRENIGVRSQLSGERISADQQLQSALLNMDLGLSQQGFANMAQNDANRMGLLNTYNTNRMNTQLGLDQQLVNLLGSKNDIPPPTGCYNSPASPVRHRRRSQMHQAQRALGFRPRSGQGPRQS